MIREAYLPSALLAAIALVEAPAMAEENDASRSPAPKASTPLRGEGPSQPEPREDQASGIVILDDDRPGSAWRWTGRVLLFPLRLTFNIVTAPPRLGLWVIDRFSLKDAYRRAFYNHDGTRGLYPFVDIESGFGPSYGLGFVEKELFERSIRTKASARFAGQSSQTYEMEVGTQRRIADLLSMRIFGRVDRKRLGRFYGVGNGDFVLIEDLVTPVAPRDAAVRTRYRYNDWIAGARAAAHVGVFHLRLGARYRHRNYNPSGIDSDLQNPIDVGYNTDAHAACRW